MGDEEYNSLRTDADYDDRLYGEPFDLSDSDGRERWGVFLARALWHRLVAFYLNSTHF